MFLRAKRQIFYIALTALIVWLTIFSVRAQGILPITQSATIREDFQGDGLGQFASYPPAQDIGYEPSITPTDRFDAPGGRALMRVVQPTRNGRLDFGVIRKVDLRAHKNSSLAFTYRINTPNGSPTLEVGMAGEDGCRYTKQVPARGNTWTRSEIALSSFQCGNKQMSSGVGIEAFYIVAKLGNANKDAVYRFLIDDILLSAGQAAEFEISKPQAEIHRPWKSQISAESYRLGETLSIAARAPLRLEQANATLKTADGRIVTKQKLYDDGTHGDAKAGDSVWTNTEVYIFATKDSTGIWNTELHGRTADSLTLSSNLRFIVCPEKTEHPHLYFGAKDRETLLARTRDPRLAKTWEYIQATAKNTRATGDLSHGGKVFELLDKEYLLPSLLGYFDVLNRARSRIAYNAFVSYLTDDAEARTGAKHALLDVTRWTRWEPPWFTAHGQHTYYPAGLLAVDVALAYDLLYDHLSETERSFLRRALIEKQIAPTYKEYFLDNRAMADTSNWISHTVGGALIAAAAIAGDVKPEESNGKFQLYVNGLLQKMDAHIAASYLKDGSYGEGISYHEFDSETLGPMTVAVRRAFGVDYFNTTNIEDSLDYDLYALTVPREASLDMGDTHPPAGHGIAPIVYQSKNPVYRWYFDQFDRPNLQQFIFFDDTVSPKSPREAGLPTSRIFEEKGAAIFRTGWGGPDEIALLFRAGANFNHHHADQGSFLLTAFGESLITEAGWSDYYKDPYYATFFTQAIGHNTILVDGNPESQAIPDTPQFKALDDYPHITDSITSEFFDGVGSELSSVYKNPLERYVRRIVFVKPHYFVVFDDLKTNGKPAQFDFLLHLPNRERIKTEAAAAVYNGKKAALGVRSFAPDNIKLSVKNGRIPYHIFSARTPAETPLQPAYLDFNTANPLSETQFLTAIVPAKTESAARELIKQMSEIEGEYQKGIRVARGFATDLIMFRTGAGNTLIRLGKWSADASVMAVTENANNLEMFAVQNARSLQRGSQAILSSDVLVSIAVNYGTGQIEAACNAPRAAKINLFTGRSPVRVLLDGKPLNASEFNFNRADGTISLTVPKGRHDLQIVFR